MGSSFRDFVQFVTALPLAKKISIAAVILLVIAGFGVMFYLANQENYQILYNGLSPEDASRIVTRLKEENIPYKITAGGTGVMVPEQSVYETRLALAAEGIPGGGTVGFELFDNPDFRTTNFVQQLNYRRALQGELARTIMNFDEVKKRRCSWPSPRNLCLWKMKNSLPPPFSWTWISPCPGSRWNPLFGWWPMPWKVWTAIGSVSWIPGAG